MTIELKAALAGYDAQYGTRGIAEQHPELPNGFVERIEAVIRAARVVANGMLLLPFNDEIKVQLERIGGNERLTEDDRALCANCNRQSWRHDELGRCPDE